VIDAADLWWLLEDLERLRAVAPQPAAAGPIVYRNRPVGAELFVGDVHLSLDYWPLAELLDTMLRLRNNETTVSFEHDLRAGGYDRCTWNVSDGQVEVMILRTSPDDSSCELSRMACRVENPVRGVARDALSCRTLRHVESLDALLDSMFATIGDVQDATYDACGAPLRPEHPTDIVVHWYLLSDAVAVKVPYGAAVLASKGDVRGEFYALNRLNGGWFEDPDLLKAYMGLNDDTALIAVDRSTFTAALIGWEAEGGMGELGRLLRKRFT